MTTEYEYQVDIDGTMYTMNQLESASLDQPLLDSFSVGNACSAEFIVSYYFHPIPKRMAKVVPYIRQKGATTWYQLGIFFVDTRQQTGERIELTCYDSMMKADQQYLNESDVGEFPRKQTAVVTEIAQRMGVAVDTRTSINPNYEVEYPNEDSMRTVLSNIAAANGGNWIITAEGKLLLVSLFNSMPTETNLLVTDDGSPILFGDTRILV